MITLTDVLTIVGVALPLAIAIARLTPTQKDDNFLAKFQTFFEKVSTLGLPNYVIVKNKVVSK